MVFLLICGFSSNVFGIYNDMPVVFDVPTVTVSDVLINKLALFGLLLIGLAYVMVCIYLYFLEEDGSNKKVSPEGSFLFFKERGLKDPDLKNLKSAEKYYNYIPALWSRHPIMGIFTLSYILVYLCWSLQGWI